MSLIGDKIWHSWEFIGSEMSMLTGSELTFFSNFLVVFVLFAVFNERQKFTP